MAFCESDQKKLEIIQCKRKEVHEKIKEMAMKAHYAVDLYNQHLDIELKKAFINQAFNSPLKPDDTSIFKVEIVRLGDLEDEYNEIDHVECALINAQKVCEESIVWTIFYSELEDLEQAIREKIDVDKKNELAETPSSVKESIEEIIIEKTDEPGVPLNGTIISSKYLQIFKRGAYELFCYLQMEYTLNDNSPVAKYSDIHHLLSRLKSNFERKSKSEVNMK